MDYIHPMRPTDLDITKLKYPVYGSPKYDGVYSSIQQDVVLSKTLKPIPNKHVQSLFSFLTHLTGELIVGDPLDKNVNSKSVSGVMAEDTIQDVQLYVFDYIDPDVLSLSYRERYNRLQQYMQYIKNQNKNYPVHLVDIRLVHSEKELLEYEHSQLKLGHEGIIIRNPDAEYVPGKATFKKGGVLRLKRTSDSEAIITGFIELMHNNNPLKRDFLGNIVRSTSKQHLVGGNTLGAFVVKDVHHGWEFEIGSGLTKLQRQEVWDNKDIFMNKIIKYSYYQKGFLNKPRQPIFLGYRHPDDIII